MREDKEPDAHDEEKDDDGAGNDRDDGPGRQLWDGDWVVGVVVFFGLHDLDGGRKGTCSNDVKFDVDVVFL